jgi:hypothetical protein
VDILVIVLICNIFFCFELMFEGIEGIDQIKEIEEIERCG